jgi:hypothetical protein
MGEMLALKRCRQGVDLLFHASLVHGRTKKHINQTHGGLNMSFALYMILGMAIFTVWQHLQRLRTKFREVSMLYLSA